MQSLGCLLLLFVFIFFCLVPLVFVDAMNAALVKLHLSPPAALLAMLGIFFGSVVNLPIYRIERHTPQIVNPLAVYGLQDWLHNFEVVRNDTLISINVGGCVVPLALAGWEFLHVLAGGQWPVVALGLVSAATIGVCYRLARPVNRIGIMLPAFVPPLVSVLGTWLLLGRADDAALRAPVAFIAGVLGPVVGADLLHLKDISKVSVGMLSIGGAGTFDGIVISGIVAAYFA